MEALAGIVCAESPDVVCFQEVIPRFLDRFLALDWVREAYVVSDSTGSCTCCCNLLVSWGLHLESLTF